MLPSTLILMGVCGCGKTRVGQLLAAETGAVFEDADDFHTEAAKEKMRAGTPLTDADRRPWYDRLRSRVEEMRGKTHLYILACSALKHMYRDWLRAGDTPEQMAFVLLDGDRELIFSRMAARKGHYMPVSLLDSQLATLERPMPEEALTVSIDRTPEEIAARILAYYRDEL